MVLGDNPNTLEFRFSTCVFLLYEFIMITVETDTNLRYKNTTCVVVLHTTKSREPKDSLSNSPAAFDGAFISVGRAAASSD